MNPPPRLSSITIYLGRGLYFTRLFKFPRLYQKTHPHEDVFFLLYMTSKRKMTFTL